MDEVAVMFASAVVKKDPITKMLKRAPAAFALGKKLLVANSTSKSVDEEEIELYASCFRTNDQKERALAFRQKREPNFTGT